MLPHFLGIGAQKSGSTWLSLNLRKHPQVHMPPLKELHYFSRSRRHPSFSIDMRILDLQWRRGLRETFKLNNIKYMPWFLKYLFGYYNDQWYESLFACVGNKRICGEITPAYSMLEKEDIKKIHVLMPNVKIIFIMRNPVDRAWSHFKNIKWQENKKIEMFDFNEIISHFESDGSFLRGDYVRTIDNWQAVFPKSQMFIGYYDEILDDPKELMFKIFNFLELNEAKKYSAMISLEKANVSIEADLPKVFRKYLSKKYYPIIKELSVRYGCYASIWLKEAEHYLSCQHD